MRIFGDNQFYPQNLRSQDMLPDSDAEQGFYVLPFLLKQRELDNNHRSRVFITVL
ncbi:hypothetical protein IQ247_19015 [Plectonema cf. radiosum LEGE 06105]|uniref:Uncharacterized protein n=1 Tax=Plectonema cf. radiosum LEGE 06105 TaxID=945769 RepID=A0A8J7FE34_9CYAN|nr:hypothetical protein [Plectonema radiosum]MBE9214733.1 hypothetical protein [Plectonema cf. radiosum LEGE 06105]